MAPRKIGILIVVFAVLLGAVLLMQRPPKQASTEGAQSGDEVLPGLDLNAVQTLRITGPEGTGVLARVDGTWRVASLHDYPVDFPELRRRLRALGELKIGQVAEGGTELLSEYGLGDRAAQLDLVDEGGSELATLTLGSTREGKQSGPYGGGYPDGQFVRAGDGPVVLVASAVGPFPADGSGWIKKQLLEVASTDVEEVSVSTTNGAYAIDFSDGHAMEGLAEDEEINTTEADRLRRALQYLSCTTVAGASDVEGLGFDKASKLVARAADGVTYTALVGDMADDGRYVRFTMAYDQPPEVTQEEAEAQVPEAPEGENTNRVAQVEAKLAELKNARDGAIQAAQEKLEELAFLEDWTFVISTYTADGMLLGRDQVVNKVEPPEEDSAGQNAADAAVMEPMATP